jgi:Ca2+-transporting ATPase
MAQYLYDFLGVGYERVKTSVFCLFVIFQLFNAFNCRKTGSESVFVDFGRNKMMTAVFVATFLFQIVITQYLCGFFSTLPLTPIAWIKIIATCGTCVVFSEGYKLVYRIMTKNSSIKIKKPINR